MQVDLFGEPMLSNPIQPSSEADAPVDLFGVAINQPTAVEKPKAVRKAPTRLVIDRKASGPPPVICLA